MRPVNHCQSVTVKTMHRGQCVDCFFHRILFRFCFQYKSTSFINYLQLQKEFLRLSWNWRFGEKRFFKRSFLITYRTVFLIVWAKIHWIMICLSPWFVLIRANLTHFGAKPTILGWGTLTGDIWLFDIQGHCH